MDSPLADEVQSINAIYGPDTLTSIGSRLLVLRLPTFSLRLSFPADYPQKPPTILGPEATSDSKKGAATELIDVLRSVLQSCFRPGEECVFTLLEELRAREEGACENSTDDETNLSDAGSETSYSDSRKPVMSTAQLFRVFIRTHHVTSRKKVARVKKSGHKSLQYLLIRSGGSPGLMYAEGDLQGLEEWVASVQTLRYKDYQLVRRPAPFDHVKAMNASTKALASGYEEVESVAGFAAQLEKRGASILDWWREAMGYKEFDP